MVVHGDTDEGNSPLSDEETSGFVEGYPGERIDEETSCLPWCSLWLQKQQEI